MRGRRLITIPGYVLAWCLWISATPVWVPLTLFVDVLKRNRGVSIRSAAIVTVYLTCEIAGLVASAALWSWNRVVGIDPERWLAIHFRLEAWWGTTLFRAIVRIFGLRVEVDGEDAADLGRGPYLLLLRHVSSADTLLASALVTSRTGIRLRYVLKNELLWDPCLDIVGNRLPNVFVDRFSDDSLREVRGVQSLARGLGPRDGILTYPEGTRFSEAKRQRLLTRLHENGDVKALEYASSLACVLPPRPGGTLGLLEVATDADVVICSHTGFEGAASLAEIWKGALLDQVIRVQFRRISRENIPEEPGARIAWILEEWKQVGDWVDRLRCGHPN